MSEENKNNASGETQEPVVQEAKQEYVSKKAYEEVSKDMHKFKDRLKQAEAKANEFAAQLKAQEEAKMHEKEQYKELFEKREAELEQIKKEANMERERYLNSVKRAALKQEIGAQVKDEYLTFANLDSISINEDGSIDKESVREAANFFRKEHGQLIAPTENTNITGHAATSQPPAAEKNVSDMNSRELVQYYAKIKQTQ